MSFRIVLWAVFLAILAIMWGREFITLGEARRDGSATLFDFQRFRRRTLGLFLLLLLGIGMDLSTWLKWDTPWQAVGFYGVFFILFLWLLIVAGRDLRATLATFHNENEGMTVAALEEIRRAFAAQRGSRDHQAIPLMDFSGWPRDGSSPKVRKLEEDLSESAREEEAEGQRR
jgi:hypothetical protein